MKKRIGILVLTVALMLSGINVWAAEKSNALSFNQYFNFVFNEVKGTQDEESFSSLKESVNELIKNLKPDETIKILNFIEKKIEEGNWETEQGIKDAIAEGEKEFGVSLTQNQKDLIMSVITKIKSFKIDPQYLIKQVESICEKYSQDIKEDVSEKRKEIMEETQNKIKEEINKSLSDYFLNMFQSVKTFFRGIFSR